LRYTQGNDNLRLLIFLKLTNSYQVLIRFPEWFTQASVTVWEYQGPEINTLIQQHPPEIYPMLFLNYFISFAIGAVFVFLLVRTGPTLKQRKVVKQLQNDNADLEDENLSLENRNINLAKIIGELQQRIKSLEESDEVMSGQVILCLDLLAGVTSIRENSNIDIGEAKIVVTERFRKKHKQFLSSNNPDFFTSD